MGDDCLETKMARATSCLGSTSADWERRVAGLRNLSYLAHEICEAPNSDVILQGLHSVLACQVGVCPTLVRPTLVQSMEPDSLRFLMKICDRRSAVAREALDCVANLARTCRSRAERLVAQLHPSIMAALATTMGVRASRNVSTVHNANYCWESDGD